MFVNIAFIDYRITQATANFYITNTWVNVKDSYKRHVSMHNFTNSNMQFAYIIRLEVGIGIFHTINLLITNIILQGKESEDHKMDLS